jgi:hypothetical protein
MINESRYRHPQYFIRSLQEYVLSPISTASRAVDRERTEITDELNAFEAFRERLIDVDPVEKAVVQGPADQLVRSERTAEQMERVRTAYRETVMETSHYEDTYDESLFEHMAGEFGAGIADGVRSDSSTVYSLPYRDMLRRGATQARLRREEFVADLDEEVESLDRARAALSDILSPLDTTVIPERYRDSFRAQIDDVAEQRQEIIRTRSTSPYLGEHSFCAYLYGEAPWTFPVLTAVTRLRESVDLDDSLEKPSSTVLS